MKKARKIVFALVLIFSVAAVLCVGAFAAYDPYTDKKMPQGVTKGEAGWIDSGYSDVDSEKNWYLIGVTSGDYSTTEASYPKFAGVENGRVYWNKTTGKLVWVLTGASINGGTGEEAVLPLASQSSKLYAYAAAIVDAIEGNYCYTSGVDFSKLTGATAVDELSLYVHYGQIDKYKVYKRWNTSGTAAKVWAYAYVTRDAYAGYVAKKASLTASGLSGEALEDALVEYVFKNFAGYKQAKNCLEKGAHFRMGWVFKHLSDNGYAFETAEFRAGGLKNVTYGTAGLVTYLLSAKTILLDSSISTLAFTNTGRGLFKSNEKLTTMAHVTFAADGSYKEKVENGVIDLSGFTFATAYSGDDKAGHRTSHLFTSSTAMENVVYFKSIVDSKDKTTEYAGYVDSESFSGASGLHTLTIPEGVTLKFIGPKAFFGAGALNCITVKGSVASDIKIAPDAFSGVMNGCIIRCATQADIDNMNKALAAQSITNVKAVSMDTVPAESPVITKVPKAPDWTEFDPTGATAYGGIKTAYADNYWAYYADTKTLTFTAKQAKAYNEIGTLEGAEDGKGWIDYKTVIEHVVIGPKIHKLSATAFAGMTALKDIKMTSDTHQAAGTFTDCPSLSTIWIHGMERVEGQAVLAGAKTNFSLSFSGTAVKSILMGSSPVAFAGNITPSAKTEVIIFDNVDDSHVELGKLLYINIANSAGKVFGSFYVDVPDGLPFCGDSSVYSFDATTGTLTVFGKGAIADTANYWGGGSKNQPWFDIKQEIRHVIITDHITAIGKYSFTECKNLETVQLPALDGFIILNAAFEKCPNLKSIYIKGNQPIEGTFDLSTVNAFESYTFSGNYMLANVIINEKVSKIGISVFEDCVNLKGIYGVPGSAAEEYASGGFTFFDKATSTPQPESCTPPAEETTVPESMPETVPDTVPATEPVTVPDSTPDTVPLDTAPETRPADSDTNEEKAGGSALPVIIVAVALVAVAAVAAVIVTKKKASQKS